MSDATHDKLQDAAVIEAAQENSQGWTEKHMCEENSVPGSPKSDSEWELLPDATVSSDCGSSATSGYVNCAPPDSVCSPLETVDVKPHLHVKLTPQGGSDVSLQLTVQDHAASSLLSTTALCKQEQQDYQDQLHKAQQTLLPQATSAGTWERSDMLSAQPQQKHTMYDDLEGHDTAPSIADPTLPTSTHPLVQEDILDRLSAADNASGPSSSRLPNSHSTGHLSVNSDGSFMHVEGLASADDSQCLEEAETTQEFATPVDLPEPAAFTALAQDANNVLDRLSEDMSGHATEASITHAKEESTEEQSAVEPDRAHKYPSWPRLAAAIQHRLTQLLSSLQVWASSAYGCLPSSASVYASTASMFGSKSPFRCLDWGHWSLVSGLVVVSAVYLLREHGLNSRERRLRKELTNSQAEISKLVMKIVNMQHSMQSPGRVPIIRHTCTMSTVTPFPLMHLV